jgi:Spy/CpxP family protein refolding chaperone
MKNLIKCLVVVGFLLVGMTVKAQQERPHKFSPDQMAQRQTEWMKTNLSLTNDQVQKVSAINLKYVEQMQAVRDSSKEMRMDKMKSMRASKDSELAGILTPEQLKAFQKHQEEMEAKRSKR